MISIKLAVISDIENISKIHAISWKAAYKNIVPQAYLDDLKEDFWVSAFENWMASSQLKVLLAFDDSKPVGCISYGSAREDILKEWGEIISIYLLPEYFGLGIGTLLLESAIDDMESMMFKNIYLYVLERNLQAQKFYLKHGFYKSEDKVTCEISGEELIDIKFIYKV